MLDHPRYWLPLMAVYLAAAALYQPIVRMLVWLILWACALTGDYPAPPAYTPWTPDL